LIIPLDKGDKLKYIKRSKNKIENKIKAKSVLFKVNRK